MRKRILSLMLAMVMLCAAIPCVASTDYGGTSYGKYLYYKVSDDGTEVSISGCSEFAEGVLEIPTEIDGLPVTSIGDAVFARCKSLKNITIPDCVTYIGRQAFNFCGSLTINVNENNTEYSSVDGVLFNKAQTKLVAYAKDEIISVYTIPQSVTSIGDFAFCGCGDLTSITIPYGVTTIGKYAFSKCIGLTSITIPDTVTTIGAGAFSKCTGLTSITIPDSVTTIGNEAFYECSNLKSVTAAGNIGNWTFSRCTNLINVTLLSGVTSIGYYAFNCCENLKNITIPNTITTIGNQAFEYCCSLKSIIIPNSITSIGANAFNCCTNLINIAIPNSVTYIGYCAFRKCNNLTDVYYTGSEAQWNNIEIDESENDLLTTATIHYNWIENSFEISDGIVTNTDTNNTHTATIIIPTYTDGVFDSLAQCEEVTFAAGETKTFTVPENGQLFVWDSLEGMRPLTK